MSRNDAESASAFEYPAIDPAEGGPLGLLPRVTRRQARLSARLARLSPAAGIGGAFARLAGTLGTGVELGLPEILDRPSGLRRTGMVAQFVWARLSTRLAFGLETPLAHAVVDRLLGFDRPAEESHLQISPVEWGILTFVVADAFRSLTERPGPLGSWDLLIDRVNADPFDASDLGRVLTFRWPLRIGPVEGSFRLWAPETLLARWLATAVHGPSEPPPVKDFPAEISGVWHARAGSVTLPRGLNTLRPGGVLPLTDSTLGGTPTSPTGRVDLVLSTAPDDARFVLASRCIPETGGGRLALTDTVRLERQPSRGEPPTVSFHPANPDAPANDVPVTLVVELGRLNLTLRRLADLKPGDVVELNRHSREPVELTSGGRAVARGELVQIDTELGVRVTHVFL